MTLARDFQQTVTLRVERDAEFAKALLDEAATLFLSGEPDANWSMPRWGLSSWPR